MNKILHILNGPRGLDTYPSVYNALYMWKRYGVENYLATGGESKGFEEFISSSFVLKGGYLRRAAQLASIGGYFDITICYEPWDMEILWLSNTFSKKLDYGLLVHHSLEIPTVVFDGIRIKKMCHRAIYSRAYPRINSILIQDEMRYNLLLRLFPYLEKTRCFFVPNSYVPAIEPISEAVPWFDVIRKEASILVIYVGAIERWALSEKLLKELKRISGVTFLFSGWSYDGFVEEAKEYCQDTPRMKFKVGKKSRAELNYIVAKSDVGLAFYDVEPGDGNISHIGMSSGKLHKYLSYGKPVIVNRLPGMKEFVERQGLGVATNLEKMAQAIRSVAADYEAYAERVANSYKGAEEYEYAYSSFIEACVPREK